MPTMLLALRFPRRVALLRLAVGAGARLAHLRPPGGGVRAQLRVVLSAFAAGQGFLRRLGHRSVSLARRDGGE